MIKKQKHHAAYYHVMVTTPHTSKLLASNNERAFVISQLQDLLSMRSLLEDTTAHKRLAAHIDLLGFSLLPHSMQFVLFSISEGSVQVFLSVLLKRLEQYQSEWRVSLFKASKKLPPQPQVSLQKLAGPHDALQVATRLHRHHQDWEFDRYSSIGFYLHDRRGDWMRIWRLSQLYGTDPATYRQIIHATSVHV